MTQKIAIFTTVLFHHCVLVSDSTTTSRFRFIDRCLLRRNKTYHQQRNDSTSLKVRQQDNSLLYGLVLFVQIRCLLFASVRSAFWTKRSSYKCVGNGRGYDNDFMAEDVITVALKLVIFLKADKNIWWVIWHKLHILWVLSRKKKKRI
jgi:hypothetical protein